MPTLRRLFRRHRALAALMLAAAMLLRVTVPAGFMPMASAGGVLLAICPGSATASEVGHGMTAMHGDAHGRVHGASHDGGPETPRGCAFADLAMPLIGGAGALLFAAAVAFVLALGFARRTALPVRAAPRLRPPPQGPPATA